MLTITRLTVPVPFRAAMKGVERASVVVLNVECYRPGKAALEDCAEDEYEDDWEY